MEICILGESLFIEMDVAACYLVLSGNGAILGNWMLTLKSIKILAVFNQETRVLI